MSNAQFEICRDYQHTVLRRGSGGTDTLIPPAHKTNWMDQPSKFKVYKDTARLRLPAAQPENAMSLTDTAGGPLTATRSLNIGRLSTLLTYTNGLLRRKTDITWNSDHGQLVSHATARYSRPAASGGGLYPLEYYLISGPGSFLLPGVYHYDNAHHALDRLYAGEVLPRVIGAVDGHPSASSAPMFLLITANFWKNCFKYYDFCYHVVTQDLGAALGAMHLVARSQGLGATQISWFRDRVLNDLLGIDGVEESTLALIALDGPRYIPPAQPLSQEGRLFDRSWRQRSGRTFLPPLLPVVHESTMVEAEPRPSAQDLDAALPPRAAAEGLCVPLPAPEPIAMDTLTALERRQSNWGKFRSEPGLRPQTLSSLLRFTEDALRRNHDLKPSAGSSLTRLMVVINHVDGIPAGSYAWDAAGNTLNSIEAGDFSNQLQRRYFLQNYNIGQASCVIVVTGRMNAILEACGNRGLRVLNAEVGMRAQAIYMAAAGLGIGAGAALGFNNTGVNELLHLDNEAETSLLMLMVGSQPEESVAFSGPLFPGAAVAGRQ